MKRMTTLVAVIGFTFFAAPLAAAADPHEGKADVNENSNAQWSDGAKKGQERADEVKNRAEHDAHKAEGHMKGKSHDAEAKAKSKADQATADAHAKVKDTKKDAKKQGADAKAKVDAAVPGPDAGGAAE